MIILDAELDDPKVAARGTRERRADHRKEPRRAQASDRGDRTEGGVHRMRCDVHRSGAVRNTRSASGGSFPASTAPAAAPRAGLRESELHGPCHLDQAIGLDLTPG